MYKSKSRGFNLVEAAIVLGVIGLVIGGIWTAAAEVTNKNRVSSFSRQLLQINHNLLALYEDHSMSGVTIASLSAAGIFPAVMIINGAVKTPWGQNITVASTNNTGITFSVTWNGSVGQCMSFHEAANKAGLGADTSTIDVDDPSGGLIGAGVEFSNASVTCKSSSGYPSNLEFVVTKLLQ